MTKAVYLHMALSAHAHIMWSGWMDYLFSKCVVQPDGSMVIPAEYVQRWTRQAGTPYGRLSTEEQKSDQVEADRLLQLLQRNKEWCP